MSEIRAEAQISGVVRAQGQVSGTLGAASIILNDWVITLSEIAGGHRLTASRSGSTQTIDIMDGEAGKDGAPGAKGEKGDTGPQGAQGPRGEAGRDGTSFTVKGRYASLSALESAQGTPEAGDAYAVGTAQANEVYVYNATSGDWESLGTIQGPKGEDGAPGGAGPQGQAATVAIGTVTTGAAGTQASVVNAGTSGAAVLNFVIPQGAKGDDGAPGTDGSDGAPGAKGVTFTPSVSEAGVLSWSNDGGLSNPASVSIKGAKGDKGDTGAKGADAVFSAGTTDLTAGSSALPAGTVYFVYE